MLVAVVLVVLVLALAAAGGVVLMRLLRAELTAQRAETREELAARSSEISRRLEGLDGLMFTGGSDVSPTLYGEQPHPTTNVKPERDAAELMLMRAAIGADLPVLGVCRGMQLMVVAYGGSLHQHLPDVLGHNNHRPLSGPKFGEHLVSTTPGSRAQSVLGDSLAAH